MIKIIFCSRKHFFWFQPPGLILTRMLFTKQILDHYVNGHEKYLRNVSVDCIVFGFHDKELKVLIHYARHAKSWALPGGFIRKDEHMDDAARRILREITSLDNVYLQQFTVFSRPDRSTKELNQEFLRKLEIDLQESWMFERFLTVGYTALVNYTRVEIQPSLFSTSCEWCNVHAVPELMLDHGEILQAALRHLQTNLNYHPIGYNLLPPKFTMPELQRLYEAILNRPLDRRNFQRKILSTGVLKKLDERKRGVAHKAPHYYSFNLKKYRQALQTGMGFQL